MIMILAISVYFEASLTKPAENQGYLLSLKEYSTTVISCPRVSFSYEFNNIFLVLKSCCTYRLSLVS